MRRTMPPSRTPPGRRLALALLACAALGLAARPAPAEEPPVPEGDALRDAAIAEGARHGVVRIQWRGTGPDPAVQERNAIVVDAAGLLLLAGPLPSPRGTLTATFPDGRATKATVVASDRDTRLTLLWVPLTGLQPLAFRPTPVPPRPSRGEPPAVPPPSPPQEAVPLGTRVVLVTGTGAAARGWIRGGDRHRELPTDDVGTTRTATGLLEAAMPVVAEDLGSPWLDGEGRVLGLLVAAGDAPSPLPAGRGPARVEPVAAHAVPASTIEIVWHLLRTHRAVPRSRFGVVAQPAGEALEVHACRGCSGGQVVLELEPEGPAARAGVERHDILLAVDGTPLRRGMTLADALLPHRPGRRVILDVVRRGDPVRLEVTLGTRSDD